MKPFLLKPVIKDYIWGGTKLRDWFGKESDTEILAESWELSCHPDGECSVANGEFSGMTLKALLKIHPEIMGTECSDADNFPILVKLIDARDNLSVQVHPDNEYARIHENDSGKTEMWYVIQADEGAELIYGFKEKISREDFKQAIEKNTLMEKLNRVQVKSGDVFFIPPHTLHAIGKGILIAEIQQSSNVTYRVYDYGRLGNDGKPRPLHIEKALEVTDTEPCTKGYGQPKLLKMPNAWQSPLCFCDYFSTTKYDIFTFMQIKTADVFMHILVINGEADLYSGNYCDDPDENDRILHMTKGSSVFVPAGSDTYYIKGKCSVIITAQTIRRKK